MANPLFFVSHAGEDTAQAKELARRLGQAGVDVWLDAERLKPGDRWSECIEKALREATAMVVYVGKSGVRRWVDQEVRVALDRSANDRGFRLIPVLGNGSSPEDLPLFLQQYEWLDLRNGWTHAVQLKSLIEGAARTSPAHVSLLPPGKSPFRGLQAFDVEDSVMFFGRDAEIDELLEKLPRDSFLAVVGDSGSGKSSLVRAGLIPALHRGRFHDGEGWVESWRVAIVRPGEDPFGELAEGLCDLKPEMSAGEKRDFLKDLKDDLATTKDRLRNAIASLVPRGARTLLVIDQFEELFTLGPRRDEKREEEKEKRKAYLNALFTAARLQGERPVHILITIRADYYSHCWEHGELTKRMATNQYNVHRASNQRLREVIEKPLALAGAKAQPGLVDTILNDVGDEPGNLPLLEHALSQLWDKRSDSQITHDAYKEIGFLGGALRNHADSVLKRLPPQDWPLARKIFLALTQLGEGAEDTRRRVTKAELTALGAGSDQAEHVLKTLTDARLLTSSRGADATNDSGIPASDTAKPPEMLEVSHEALIRQWPELRGWVQESREELQFERRLIDAVAVWQKGKQDAGLLWTGTWLARANEWGPRHESDQLPEVQAFLTASRNRAQVEVRKARRARIWIGGLVFAVLLTATGFAGWIAWQKDQEAKRLFENSIVRDGELMWTRNDNGESVDWTEAETYCKNLPPPLDRLKDWRMPTIEELRKLYDPKNEGKYKIRKPFRLTHNVVWSSWVEVFKGSPIMLNNGSRRQDSYTVGFGLNFAPSDFHVNEGLHEQHPIDLAGDNRALCVRRSAE